MATWKEKGVVLDSDDEDEEGLDTQETFFDEPAGSDANDLTIDNATKHIGADSEDELAKDGYDLQFNTAGPKSGFTTSPPHDAGNANEQEALPFDVTPNGFAEDEGMSISRVSGDVTAPNSTSGRELSLQPETSPVGQRAFQEPPFFEDHGLSVDDDSSKASESESSQPGPSHMDSIEVDEISKSYVQLSSPLSTPPVPFLGTPPRNQTFRQASIERHDWASPMRAPSVSESHTVREKDPLPLKSPSSEVPRRRPLRPRNALQTMPYTMEQALYRKRLHGAGIAPISIVEEEEQVVGHDEDSQDTQFEAEEDSQNIGYMAVDHPSSQTRPVFDDDSDDSPGHFGAEKNPTLNASEKQMSEQEDDPFRPFSDTENPRSPQRGNIDGIEIDFEEDSDGLPEVSQIFKRPANSSSRDNTTRKRPRTYKNNRSVSGANQRPGGMNGGEDAGGNDIYDFPPSPPTTSSLPDGRRPVFERLGSIGSRISSPLNSKANGQSRVTEVSTPALSAAKRSEIVPLDSSSEDEGGELSSAGTSRASSADPDDRFRRVAKRIRGVLPASWLRLDKKPQASETRAPNLTPESDSEPTETAPRGVAVRRPVPSTALDSHNPYFLDAESDADEGDDGNDSVAAVDNENLDIQASQFGQSLASSIFDDAIEDDRIDRMLPSRKRASTTLNSQRFKKRRVSGKSFHGSNSGHARQPKITEQFDRSLDLPSQANNRRPKKIYRKRPAQNVQEFVHPRLGSLDVIDTRSQASTETPAFLRIARRTARSRRKLDDVDDNNDAENVLREWRERTILPNKSLRYVEPLPRSLQRRRSRDEPARTVAPTLPLHVRAPRKLVLAKGQQTTLDGVVRNVAHESRDIQLPHSAGSSHPPHMNRRQVSMHQRSQGQPAQLETDEREYNRVHPNAGFGTTKKGLDRLYRQAHRGAVGKGDVQLARFFADPDAVGSIVDDLSFQEERAAPEPDVTEVQPSRPSRRRKRSPKHTDVGAYKHRQSRETLPLGNFSISENTSAGASSAGKLLGLQPYGTRYTYHFNVFPLQLGVFFHESTFIGSGRLSRVLSTSFPHRDCLTRCVPCLYQLDEKLLRWAKWDDVVSSEMGLCFDWISGQLEAGASPTSNVLELVDFILKYVQHHLFFEVQDDQGQSVRRLCEIVDGFFSRAPESFEKSGQQSIEIAARFLVLLMQLLRMCQRATLGANLVRGVEASLQRASERCAGALISLGLGKVREFYEECQHLSSRESGVRQDKYYIEAWIILMKVMQEAKIPGSYFWDLVNKRLLIMNLDAVDDAQVFERIWHDMYSLMPLAQFDEAGIIQPGLRHIFPSENWAVPQKLMKRVFTMYALKSRQSAGFNDYVRTLFVRCHHLIVAWGWRRSGRMIGTFFDFFASHDLAHLRNEESFASPRFLDELDAEPSLDVEAEDKCFHIFLKIVATSIKQMRQVDDTKGIRNLVARLLPNHDRQYSKHEAIHQRDLASLRNHHDLLCTLFWAAPSNLRPSIMLLRKLVVPEYSHQEACLMNLRAWSKLSKFLLATSPVPDDYQKLVSWQQDVFSRLVQKYQTAEEEIRQQHANLPDAARQSISEQSVVDTINANKKQVIEEIRCHLRAIILHMRDAKDIEVAKTIFIAGRVLVTSVFGMFTSNASATDRMALEAALLFVDNYISKAQQHQNSLPALEYEEREAILLRKPGCLSVFDDKFLEILGKLVARMLERKLLGLNEKLVVEVWAKISACRARHEDFFRNKITILQTRVGAWISGHRYPVGASKDTKILPPLFMALFIQQVPEQVLRRATVDRDMFQEWLCSIAKPAEQFAFEDLFTLSIVDAHQIPPSLLKDYQHYFTRKIINLDILKTDRFVIIEGSIKYISDAYKESQSHFKVRETRTRLSNILKCLMATLEEHYKVAFNARTSASMNYQQFVCRTISCIKIYTSDVCPLGAFFTQPGTIYYHSASDGPNFFVPKMINLGLRISEGASEQGLLHYCWESIKGMVRRQESQRIQSLLLQVMDYDVEHSDTNMSATKAILKSLAPAAFWAALQNVEGFIIADLMIGVVEEQVLALAAIDIGIAAEMALPVTRCVVQGLWSSYASSTPSISKPHLHLFTRVVRFMSALWDLLSMAAARVPDLLDLLQRFDAFAKAANIFYEENKLVGNIARFQIPPDQRIQDVTTLLFGKVMIEEYARNWSYRNGGVWVQLDFRTKNSNSSAQTGEVLLGEMGGEKTLANEKDLLSGLADVLMVHNELVGKEDRGRKKNMEMAVMGLESVALCESEEESLPGYGLLEEFDFTR